ncbi:MAG: hypothetical protein OXF98_14925 [Rhodospirillaceae bacterium]|nr:hypothetical protein [Rhodospirillaceae bacterium]
MKEFTDLAVRAVRGMGEVAGPGWLLAGSLMIWGCESGTSTGPAAVTFSPAQPSGQGFAALYAPPPYHVVPYPNDIYNPVAAGLGATLNVPATVVRPLAAAVNTLDGFSTVAKITAPFNAPIEAATLIGFNPAAPAGNETVFVLDATRGIPLVAGVDYSVGVSTAAGTGGSVLEITPLRPLAPKTTYVFVLTSGIRSTLDVPASADQAFGAVRDAHLAGLRSVPGAPELDPLFPAIAPLIDAAAGLLRIPGDSVAVAWSATTQSVSEVLQSVRASATAMPHRMVPMGITTAQLGLGLPGAAALYTGWMQVPYFGDRADVLGSVWVNSELAPPTAANPHPVPREERLRIPVLAAAPSAGAAPADGWPVVLFQHGVTSNRVAMIAIADALARAGFALVGIDLPLHGVTDTRSIFYQGPGTPLGDNERHFNLDNVGALGSLVPDGQIDNGWQIFNVAHPLNARDHGRQAVSDLFHLIRTVPVLDYDGDGLADLDASRIHFLGVSLGAIFAMPFLALNSELSTVTLSSAGGPYSQFLLDPMAITFGRPIRAAVEAAGLPFGTVGFDNFVRDLQTVLDSIDPVNYAAAAASAHPIHMVGVLSDTAVPMTLINTVAEYMGLSTITTTTTDAAGVRGIVRFNRGSHGAILNPADPAVTLEMQTQAVTFAASGGTLVPIGNAEIVQ